jgi:lactate permease
MTAIWQQNIDPLGNAWLSTLAAAIPVCTIFFFLAVIRSAAWRAAMYGFVAAIAVALFVFHMPPLMIAGAVADGFVFGWFRMAWIVVAAVFVYDLSVESGQFAVIKQSIADLSGDRRAQALLIAFAFGALLEGAGGGGAPVAVTGAMMIGLGFPPFQTALLCLIANSGPVAFGGLGNPVRTLVAVTGLPEADFSAMLGRILPFTTLILPAWLAVILSGWRAAVAFWPGILICGVTFSAVQFFWSNYVDASLVDIAAAFLTMLALAFFLRMTTFLQMTSGAPRRTGSPAPRSLLWAWSPYLLLTAFVVFWGAPSIAHLLDQASWKPAVPGLHLAVFRMPPVVRTPIAEAAVFDVSWLSTPGTATFLAGLAAGWLAGFPLSRTLRIFRDSFRRIRLSVVAIMAMLGVGYVTRYCGMDATLGMALSHTGPLFPFFGAAIGWVGVALSGSDAGSNALFGSLQAITATRLGLSPVLMGAANSAGGVMGKMIAAQSLVIGCAVTGLEGQEGRMFRAVLKHSIALLLVVGAIVLLYAYLFPGAIPSGHHYIW